MRKPSKQRRPYNGKPRGYRVVREESGTVLHISAGDRVLLVMSANGVGPPLVPSSYKTAPRYRAAPPEETPNG